MRAGYRSGGARYGRRGEEWTRIIARFRRSGLTRRRFCEREEVSLSAIQNWLYRRSKSSTAANFDEVVQVDLAELISNRTATSRVAEVDAAADAE